MSTGIAIMTSGGDSAGMNPAVKCAVEYATQKGHRPFLIYDGLRGLIEDGYGHPPIRAAAGVR
jgi:6-phosphofructokinase 1